MTAGSTQRRSATGERLGPWLVLAIVLAVLGAVASLWRPLAPVGSAVVTDLDDFDRAVLAAVQSYRAPRLLVAGLATGLEVALPIAFVASRRGRQLVARVAGPRSRSPLRAAAVAAVVAMSVSVLLLPLAGWSRVVHDGRWQFRTQSAAGWFRDWFVVSAGRWLMVAFLAAVLVAAMDRWPRSWPYRLTVLGTALAAVLVLVHPVLLQPILLPTTALPEGPHRDAIAPVLAASGEPDLPLMVGEASRRSTRVNALVTGLGPTARVVLYDNLLELPPEQVASVVAHELAHHEHADLPRGVALTATALLPSLLLLRALLGSSAVRRRLDPRGPADPRLVAVVIAFAAVVELVGQPGANLVSRRLEAAADLRAMELTEDPETLIRATRVFTVRDLSMPEPPAWVTVLFRTHPSVGQRIRSAADLAGDRGITLPALAQVRADEREQRHPAVAGGPP